MVAGLTGMWLLWRGPYSGSMSAPSIVPDRASVVSTLCTSAVPWFKNTGGAGTHTGRTSEPIRHALLTRRETLGPSLKKRRFHRLDLT